MRGTIKSYLDDKGYGFIVGDDGRDYFFHASAFKNDGDRAEICDGLSVVFDGVPTPKGYRAKTIEFESEPLDLKFEVPVQVQVSKGSTVRGWQLLEESSWEFVISSRESIDDTREELCRRARQFGANALINYHYSRRTGSEPGTGKGTHHFTIHEMSARPANVAKRSHGGALQRTDFEGLDSRIERYLEKRRMWQKRLSVAALVVSFAVLASGSKAVSGPAVASLVIAAVTFYYTGCRWIRST